MLWNGTQDFRLGWAIRYDYFTIQLALPRQDLVVGFCVNGTEPLGSRKAIIPQPALSGSVSEVPSTPECAVTILHDFIWRLCSMQLFISVLRSSNCRGQESIPGQSMWDLWSTKWHWGKFFSKNLSSPSHLSLHQCSILSFIVRDWYNRPICSHSPKGWVSPHLKDNKKNVWNPPSGK
jgi:hypothetical protein